MYVKFYICTRSCSDIYFYSFIYMYVCMYVERNASATICLWTFCHVTLLIVFHYIYREKDRCMRQRNRKRPRSMQNLKHVMRFQILLLMTSKTKQSLQQHCDPYVFKYVCIYVHACMYVFMFVFHLPSIIKM